MGGCSCHIVNFVNIYTHPVNSKFTIYKKPGGES